ncbi:MAG: hypothetical protein ACRBF0_22570 [Calditrichia bacterium]
MGTWNTRIKGNDTTLDIYSRFFDLYNEGMAPVEVCAKVWSEFEKDFSDYEDRYNLLFGFALAQWETNCLEEQVFAEVKNVIEQGLDLKLWADLGADKKTIKRRDNVLKRFLIQLSTQRSKAKRRVKSKFNFSTNALAEAIAPDAQKSFKIQEEFVNNKYVHTSGILMWFSGGGAGVFYYDAMGRKVSARWVDSQNLEIRIEKGVEFSKQETRTYYCGDDVIISYKWF